MTMTREEAIKRLEVVKTNALIQKKNDVLEYWQEEIDETIEAVDMAIEAISESYWIPISEGLPNEQESVNITAIDDSGDNEWRYTTTAWRIHDIWISNDEVVMGTVIAWASLPKPYERDKL